MMRAILHHTVGLILILAKLVSRNTTNSAPQEVSDSNVNTDWMQFPGSGLNGKHFVDHGSSKIRDIFTNYENTLTSDLRTSKSPTLELAFGDTGEKSFLEKNTIKHSISDMATLTKASRLLGDKIHSCNAIQEGPKIYFPICPGDIVVVTIAGSMKMTCHEIEKRIFYGPVTLKSVSCQQSLLFDMECGKKEALKISSTSCSGDKYQYAFIAMSILFALSLVTLYALTSWYFGMERGVIVGGKQLKFKKTGCYYEVSYKTFINGEGKKEIISDNSSSVVNMETNTVRKHWIKLLLIFMVFRPINVKAYELVETYDSTILKYNYKILMSDSEVIDFGSGKITREVVVHTSNLAKLFDTAKWSLDIKEEYFCQWYKCEAVSICGIGALPFIKIGRLANEIFGFKYTDRSYYTCQKLQGYCTFGNGCKLIAFEIIPSDKEVFSVYSMTVGGSHGGEIKAPVGCVVDNIEDKSAGLLSNYLLLVNKDLQAFICHTGLFSRKPEMGMLGDLQITSDGKIHFASDEVACVADHGDRALCRYGAPFMDRLDDLCEKVSELPFKASVDVVGKTFSWKQSGDAIVSLKCDRKLPFVHTNSHCINIQIKVWEVAHLDSQLLLSFRADSTAQGSIYKFPSMIHMSSNTFTCDGKNQLSELYDLKSLAISGLNYTLDSIPYNSIDNLQDDHFSDSDPDQRVGVTVLDKVMSTLPFWGLSGTTILIIIVIGLIILRRP